MQMMLLPGGRLRVQDQFGGCYEIGAEHPDYQRLIWQCRQQPLKRNLFPARMFGLLMMAVGAAAWWYNWHLAVTQGQFYIKSCILGPLGVFGGLLMLIRPDWAGPWRRESAPARKFAMIAVMGLAALASGADFYLLNAHGSHNRSITRWSPAMGTPAAFVATDMTFLGRTYRLASFNQKRNATWEFVTEDDRIEDWKTLLTIIDRPDARTREELDRLAQGIMETYKSNGGRILAARTIRQDSGDVFNYLVAAFEERGSQRYELNFVKMALGGRNAVVMVYGVRITDARDYRTKAKEFLDRSSGEIGRALGEAALPDLSKLPRKAF